MWQRSLLIMKVNLAICAIIKNEASYIKEWIDYHLMVGVQKFYIFDNDSSDNVLSVLAPYIYRGIVEYDEISGYGKQVEAYNICLEKHRDDVKWLAFIDIDEFIVPVEKLSILDVLSEYENASGIGINWILYDYCGHVVRPKGGVLENFVRCFYDYNNYGNHHIKTILRPNMTKSVVSPHSAVYRDGVYAEDENHDFISGNYEAVHDETFKCCFTKNVSVNKLRINHYWSKSFEEALLKINRGRAVGKIKRTLTRDMWNYSEYTYDFCMYRFVMKMYPLHFIANTWNYLKCIRKAKKIHRKYETDNMRLMVDSCLFDDKYYRKIYKLNKETSAVYHYFKYGWKLGYNPSVQFDGNMYLAKNDDVYRAGMCPLVHYLRYGKQEGRQIFSVC